MTVVLSSDEHPRGGSPAAPTELLEFVLLGWGIQAGWLVGLEAGIEFNVLCLTVFVCFLPLNANAYERNGLCRMVLLLFVHICQHLYRLYNYYHYYYSCRVLWFAAVAQSQTETHYQQHLFISFRTISHATFSLCFPSSLCVWFSCSDHACRLGRTRFQRWHGHERPVLLSQWRGI